MLKFGKMTLGPRPAVAVAIQEAIDPADIAAACPGAIVELRLDHLPEGTPESFRAFAGRYGAFPRLATIRHADEGGGWRGSERERLAGYEAVIPVVEAVDVEIASGEITREVVALAHGAGRPVIASFHDFDATPTSERLAEVHALGRELGADIVKVAARCKDPEDLHRLAAFTLEYRRENVIVVGMGPCGLASRIFFPALGSLITYTFLGEPTAPGQLNCRDTLMYLSDFYPQGMAMPD